jgi:serine O-acetyltransferase
MEEQRFAGSLWNDDKSEVLRQSKAPSFRKSLAVIRSDLLRYGFGDDRTNLLFITIKCLYSHPASLGVIYYRIGQWLQPNRNRFIGFLPWIFYRLGYPIVRMYSGVELSPLVQIGPGLAIFHFGPTVIHPGSIAGKNLTLLHGVTIGIAKTGTPCLGDDVFIGAHASVIGGVVIGNHVQIGAGAVVTADLPDNCVAVGSPARPVSNNGPKME